MPGILPMKVIKVGTSSQSRIAQACDRCRSKKIRCDGITPCCTQCKNVGFECKTSDKLSRRAFPRGYTESLEERVRALEAEVRDLKGLLDEKDEKIDLLSKIHSFSPSRRPSNNLSLLAADSAHSPARDSGDDTFRVRQVPFLQKSEQKSDPFFMGTSSARALFDTVKCKVQETGKPIANAESSALFGRCDLVRPAKRADFSKNVPCMVSDQLINIFFQEWSPLFPILHRPTFLDTYKSYSNEPESIKDPVSVAQLNLVFGIAALANESNKDLVPYFESQWQGALGAILHENKLSTLQCLVLAQIYCMARGDYNKLLYYTGVAVNLSHRLGLHQSQKRFQLGALTRETRKKVFWTLYTLDAFAAASLGLPKLMKDEDVETEDPADVDDENVNERGFQSTLPGESTKLSSALALFRIARILSKVLNELYPAKASHELSLQKVGALSEELDAWRKSLAPHLRLEFVQDKPSTKVISSRSPLLALTYYYVQSLIQRPVISSGLQAQAQSYILGLADSSKHVLQIIQLLNERRMSFTICINKAELVTSCGLGLILQMLDLPTESKLFKDTQQSLVSLMEIMDKIGSPAASAFRKFSNSFYSVPELTKPGSRRNSSSSNGQQVSQETPRNAKDYLQAIATRFSFNAGRPSKLRTPWLKQENNSVCDMTPNSIANNLSLYARAKGSQTSFSSTTSEPILKSRSSQASLAQAVPNWNTVPNLDYLPLSSQPHRNTDAKTAGSPDITDWDHLIGTFDIDITQPQMMANGNSPPQGMGTGMGPYSSPQVGLDWGADWNGAEGWCLFDMPHHDPMSAKSVESVLSISDESLTSGGEEFSNCDLGSEFRGYSIPVDDYRGDDLTAHQAQAQAATLS